MRYVLLIIALCALGVGGYYLARERGFLGSTLPYNPPTAEDLRRLEEIQRSSATIAPDANPGASVRPPGSLPRPIEATTTAATSSPDVTSTTSSDVEGETPSDLNSAEEVE